jgi:hypothetical protein
LTSACPEGKSLQGCHSERAVLHKLRHVQE